jgi:HSP20 family protein
MSSYVPAGMSSIRQDAFDGQIDRVLDEALRAFGQHWMPPCNVWDDENGFYVELALSGWEANQVALELNNQILTVKGEQKQESGNTGRYHVHEINSGGFVRRFKLPSFVDQDKASATQKNGVLTVAFPKREEAKSRRILIEGQ